MNSLADWLAMVLDGLLSPLMTLGPVCEWLLAGMGVVTVIGFGVWWWTLDGEVR